MKLNRNYLTSTELMDIVKELVQHDNVVEREIIKIAMLVQILTDCEKKETVNDYYDEYVQQKDIDFEIDVCNAYMVDKLVEVTDSMSLADLKEIYICVFLLDYSIEEAINKISDPYIKQNYLKVKTKSISI